MRPLSIGLTLGLQHTDATSPVSTSQSRNEHAALVTAMRRAFSMITVAGLFGCSTTPSFSVHDDAGVDASFDAGVTSYCSSEGTPLVAYPPAPHGFGIGQSAPEANFATETGGWSTREAFTPCASNTAILVLRISAAWCGTCRRDAIHTNEWLSQRNDVTLIELVYRDEQNAPADLATVKRWKQLLDVKVTVAAAPDFPVKEAMALAGPLPLYVTIDPKTMRVIGYATNPSPEYLAYALDLAIADMRHEHAPAGPSPTLADGYFTRDQVEMMKSMTAPGAPPPDKTNAKADDPQAAAFGEALFSDTDVSPAKVACASCHDAKREFTDGLQTSATADKIGRVNRNAPSVRFASYSPWQFWDGRADSLWMQALGPPESSAEMGSSRLYIAHLIAKKYSASYESVFGSLPAALSDLSRFPAAGKPGDASYDTMSQTDKDAVSRVYVNFGKSIAAFERTLRPKASRFDRYIGGDTSAFSDEEKVGFQQFFAGGCAQCHYGPRLTDDAFHNLRFATGRVDAQADRGRIDAITQLASSEFRSSGPYSDAPSDLLLPPIHDSMLGAFKTPALRGVPATGPYGHGGSMGTLADVVRAYGNGGLASDEVGAVGEHEPWVTQFASNHDAPLVAFLRTLSTEE